jgi:flagella basal body P-ring formation protein FlgA
MNPNGTYESEVNRKIDRALATGQPTGEPIVDELASTQPKANPAFQQRLEDTLIERLEARNKPMNNTVVVEPKTPRKRFSLPATLVAAMLAVLFGGVIFSGMYGAPNSNSAAPILSPERTAEQVAQIPFTPTPLPLQVSEFELSLSATALMATSTQQILDLTLTADSIFLVPSESTQEIDPFVLSATALVATSTQQVLDLTISPMPPPAEGLFITFTPVEPQVMVVTTTPMPVIDIVVAVQPIARGQVITEDMVVLRPFPEEYAPITVIGDVQAVIGQVASTDIVRELPVLSSMITDELAATTIPDNLVEIVVAVQPIARGQVITEDMITLRAYLPDEVPVSAVTELEAVIGNIARTDIVRDQPILSGLIAEEISDFTVPYPDTLVSIPVDDWRSSSVKPGERVDVLTVDMGEVVVWDALVVWVGEETSGIPTPAISKNGIVSIAVSPDDIEELENLVATGSELMFTLAQQQRTVVIARVDIPAGTTLTEAMLALASYPADAVPVESFNTIADAVGMVANSPISQGYPVIRQGAVFATPTKTFTPTITPTYTATRTPTPVLSDVSTMPPAAVGLCLTFTGENGAEIRVAPDSASETIGTLPIATSVVINGQDTTGEWYYIRTSADIGLNGWVVKDEIIISCRGTDSNDLAMPTLLPTFTPVGTMLATLLPPIDVMCEMVVMNPKMLFARVGASDTASITVVIPPATSLRVLVGEIGRDDQQLWYLVNFKMAGLDVGGWVKAANIMPLAGTECPITMNGSTIAPTLTPTPEMLCQLVVTNGDGIFVRSRATAQSSRVTTLPFGSPMNVTQQARGIDDGEIWYFITAQIDGQPISGWIPERNIRTQPGSVCPPLPDIEPTLPATPTPAR